MSSNQANNRLRSIAISAVLMVGGLACGGILILLLIRLVPQLEPGGQHFIFTDYDGDTFRHEPGLVRPPAENRLLEDVMRYDDADGFRRPAWVADSYPIIALGDSFTDGGQVPWVDVLAKTLNIPVRNLGWSGFGPLEYAEVMHQYGAGGGDHQWVLVMFFEGNDLSNVQTTYAKAEENGGVVPLNLTRTIGAPINDVRALGQYSDITLDPNNKYLYPLEHVRPDGSTFEMAYISDYLWWLNGEKGMYTESRNIAEFQTALERIKSDAGDACVGLVYAPSKEHIYFQYSDPDGNRKFVLENARTLIPGTDGWLGFTGLRTVNWKRIEKRIDNEHSVIQEVAAAAGLQFIDLLPAMQDAATTGDLAYYPYDSHWSRRGHQIAGETVAAYIQAHPCG
ncbi:MAG TPA: GDSL-type esterase/lipase family protein [Phototrophicaceae bacterium]|nr:GDSL-type esterase/lipase family protein [Phototrophicaceae bacterium]